jgi:hypothetical protein
MTAAPKLRFTFREYLEVDDASSTRHEFLDGMITRHGTGWSQEVSGPGEHAQLNGIGCALDVEAIFKDPLAEA